MVRGGAAGGAEGGAGVDGGVKKGGVGRGSRFFFFVRSAVLFFAFLFHPHPLSTTHAACAIQEGAHSTARRRACPGVAAEPTHLAQPITHTLSSPRPHTMAKRQREEVCATCGHYHDVRERERDGSEGRTRPPPRAPFTPPLTGLPVPLSPPPPHPPRPHSTPAANPAPYAATPWPCPPPPAPPPARARRPRASCSGPTTTRPCATCSSRWV